MGYLISAYVIILLAIASYGLILLKRQKDIERDLNLLQKAEGKP